MTEREADPALHDPDPSPHPSPDPAPSGHPAPFGLAELGAMRGDLIERPRLLDVLAGRFDREVTVLHAGAGFGKSTLLSQALRDPVAAARGIDVYHRVTASDNDPARLAEAMLQLVDGAIGGVPGRVSALTATDVEQVVDAIWHAAPLHVCLTLDDAHLLTSGGPCWQALDRLLDRLPINGHLVLSARRRPGVRLTRRIMDGSAVELDEATLAFTSDELDRFAAVRHVDRSALSSVVDDAGWPALVELHAHLGMDGARRFVAEEILDDLQPDRLRALRRVAVADAVDDEIVAAVDDSGRTAAELVADLPLTTAVSTDGSTAFVLHDIWREVLLTDLSDAERSTVRSQLGAVMLRRDRLREAAELAVAAADIGLIRRVLTAFDRDIQLAHSVTDREAVLRIVPAELADLPELRLLRADSMFATEPTRAAAALRDVIATADAPASAEIAVLAHVRLGELAYRSGDVDGLSESMDAVARAEQAGTVGAGAAHGLLDVWRHMLDNAAEKALTLIGSDALQTYPPIASLVDYYRAVLLGFAGHVDASLAAIDDLRSRPQGRILSRMGGFVSIMKWYAGQLTEADRDDTRRLLSTIGRDRQVHLFVEGAATAALLAASAGEVSDARHVLAEAQVYRDRVPDSAWGAISMELAQAALDLLAGDEAMAAARLEEALPRSGPFEGFGRHVFGNVGALLYTLVPRSRPYFDAEQTGPDLEIGTRVGRALVAWREQAQMGPAARLPWDDLGRIRTWALEPHLAELAVVAVAGGALRAGEAIESMRTNPRPTLRRLAENTHRGVADVAAARLSTTAERPATTLRIGVLGPLEVRQGDRSLAESAPMRRSMVRELLLLLVHRRRIRRHEAIDVLWPDKDEKSGGNNLRVTLTHLRTLLEPDDATSTDSDTVTNADADAPPWHLRSDGDHLILHDSDRLVVDADSFDHHLELARRADRNREPERALHHYDAACALFRGEYLADATDPDWAYHHRMKVHLDFTDAAARASELLAVRGHHERAASLAVRAIEVEPLDERAHRALVRARLVGGDRVGARAAHRHLLDTLDADGLTPDDATVRLGAELG